MFEPVAKPGVTSASSAFLRLPAWRWMFPLAALHAALMAPLSLLSLYHQWQWLELATPVAHAREMLFGFALLVVAGYLLGPLPRRQLAMLVGLWSLGRLGVLDWPGTVLASLADGIFALWVAVALVPRFTAAKKWRNRLLSPLLGLICLLAVTTLAWRHFAGLPASGLVMHLSVLWLVLLMAFMGGRIIAPAVNAYLIKQRGQAGKGVQPRLEAALIVLLGLAPLLMLVEWLRPLAALMVLMAGGVVLWRIFGWEPWRCRKRPDLMAMMLGYGWVAVGLLLLARSWWETEPASTALHAFSIGALGTLASSIMLRHLILRAKQRPEQEWSLWPLAGLFAVAATLRLLAIGSGVIWLSLLWASALTWSLAWLLVAWRLRVWIARLPQREMGRLDPGLT